jgi:hypothetical protein
MNKHGLPDDNISVATDWIDYPEHHNWQRELKKLGLAGILKRGEVSMLNIAHDDWCDSYHAMRCNCRPQILDIATKAILNTNSTYRPIQQAERVRPIRIYRGVDSYHSYRSAFRGEVPLKKLDQQILIEVGHLAQLLKWDTPIFFVCSELLSAIEQTDAPSELPDLLSMKLPFESAVFVMPRNRDLARIEYSRFTDNHTDIPQGFYSFSFDVMECQRFVDEPLLLNLFYAMAARPEYVEGGSRVGTHKKSGAEIWTPNLIGRKYQSKSDPNMETGTHISPRMHWRRGHFRHQAYGVGRMEHKIIWIEPMLIGARVVGGPI